MSGIAMKKTVWTAIFVIVFLAGSQVTAQRNGFMIQSTRSVGMGGTGVALVGPDNTVFLNPALLTEIDHTFIRLVEVQAMVNGNTFKHYGFYEDHQNEFENFDDLSAAERTQFYSDMLDAARDETVFGFQGMAPLSIVRPGFSAGVFERATVKYDMREGASSLPLIQADAVAEGEIIVGGASTIDTFFGKALSFGGNAKFLYRAVAIESKTAPAVETIDNVHVYRGWTMAFDAGLLMKTGRWSFGAGFYDFNYPKIRWHTGEEPPEGFRRPDGTVDGSMRIGVAYDSSFEVPGLLDRLKLAFDVESPTSSDMSIYKKLLFGAEARFANAMLLRAGLHQGYPTAGLGVMFKIVKFEYAFSGEALGMYPGQLETWNHYISVGLGWGY